MQIQFPLWCNNHNPFINWLLNKHLQLTQTQYGKFMFWFINRRFVRQIKLIGELRFRAWNLKIKVNKFEVLWKGHLYVNYKESARKIRHYNKRLEELTHEEDEKHKQKDAFGLVTKLNFFLAKKQLVNCVKLLLILKDSYTPQYLINSKEVIWRCPLHCNLLSDLHALLRWCPLHHILF